MKLPPPATDKACDPCSTAMYPKEEYPWGLRLHLEGAQLEALGIAELPEVDIVVTLTAKAKVVSVSSSASSNAKQHRSVSLQITDLALGADKAKKKTENVLYGEEE